MNQNEIHKADLGCLAVLALLALLALAALVLSIWSCSMLRSHQVARIGEYGASSGRAVTLGESPKRRPFRFAVEFQD